QAALHLEEGDLDRVALARLDQRGGAPDQLANAFLQQGGLVERSRDRFLETLRKSQVHRRWGPRSGHRAARSASEGLAGPRSKRSRIVAAPPRINPGLAEPTRAFARVLCPP